MSNKNKINVYKLAGLVIKVVWGILCLLMSIVLCDDFYEALKYPEKYYFGSEAMGYLYKTQELYLYTDIVLFFWFAGGFLFCLLQRKFQKLKWEIIIHLLLTLLYIVITNHSL